MRSLDDYPAVPGTPPPQEKKDKGLANLENELHQERAYVEIIDKENHEIERIVSNLDKELHYIRSNFPQTIEDGVIRADNEHWFKYQAQHEVNRKLLKEKKHLDVEIKQIEEQGVVNLDSLTQSELIMFVKQLERTTTDLTSELRAAEWSLDKQAKESHHLEQIRGQLDAEIRHYDEELAMFRYYNKTSCPSATSRSSLQVNSLRNDVNFSSLDEGSSRRSRNISPTPGFQRHTLKGGIAENHRILDPKKGPINKKNAAGTLPCIKNTTPAIVVTDANGSKTTSKPKKILESRLDMPQQSSLVTQSERNFENSPPPRPSSAGFTFEEDLIKDASAEISGSGQVTLRLPNNRSLVIQLVVEDKPGVCASCRHSRTDSKLP